MTKISSENVKGYSKIRKTMIRNSKAKLYNTSNGDVLLNPIKKALKGKKYINPEFEYIAQKEIENIMNDLSYEDNLVHENNVD